MTEKKNPGLFGRLFGGKAGGDDNKNADAPETEAPAPEAQPESRPVPESFDPGPPETTPEYAEEKAAEPQDEPVELPSEKPERKSWFQRLASGLKRTSDQLGGGIAGVFTKRKLDRETLQDLEDILVSADLGIETATNITEALAADRFDREVSPEDVRAAMAEEIERVLTPVAKPLEIAGHTPFVILMVGVNGSGKTTTIGKLTQKLRAEGKSVLLAAGDTFRAAAVEQLQVWGQRTGVDCVTKPTGADASGLAYEAVEKAKADGTDVLIIDTAGRLQNRDELMAELEKIIRVIKKLDPSAPHAVLLTLDATTGQNALNQVEIFGKRAGVTGLVMTKLDGTARGGILVAIAARHSLPVHFIGVGEAVEDLEPFSARDFAALIAGKD